ncbi:MAG: 50S ribosomal protein L22 [Candidatus Eremiobacteraeota bacterium]|nr:50S ribosomal protein L22 [Candidatus Eremiobacteraeota bacterium]MBV8204958.1 50S ribosomal protein L22 [Candidatus Eremiobacteraeota bacterium]MBV8262989.1 50S ribosomal protein L22 [Candidatus Eremiobacteraeota bacterium]MBV8339294.1 50S ribosomal protein L22 [Candidatus Eremiobacteraeota bacterium]MBV8461567.1 50S ribosomal protein L22 [Candidatus Eremiobacteraeota bacterium]
MNARATVKFLRVPPRKARRVVDAIRGQRVDRALTILDFTPVAAAKAIQKIVRSAVANAENNHGMKPGDLVIARASVDGGPSFKRLEARARGQAGLKRRRMSHVTIVVTDGEEA